MPHLCPINQIVANKNRTKEKNIFAAILFGYFHVNVISSVSTSNISFLYSPFPQVLCMRKIRIFPVFLLPSTFLEAIGVNVIKAE